MLDRSTRFGRFQTVQGVEWSDLYRVQRADELVGLSTLGGNEEWRSVMSQFASFETRLVLSQPTCPQCGARMWLARIEPDEPGHDKRTFECPSCEKVVSEIVKYR